LLLSFWRAHHAHASSAFVPGVLPASEKPI
jgi:hypothetical protein